MLLAARNAVCCLFVAAVLAGCSSAPRPLPLRSIGRDPVGSSWLIGPDSAGTVRSIKLFEGSSSVAAIPRPSRRSPVPRAAQQRPLDKLQPTLREWWVHHKIPPDSNLTVIVALQDTFTLPMFPRGDPHLSHDDSMNVKVRASADSLVAVIRNARDDQYSADSTDIRNRANPLFRSRFWLIQGYVLDVKFSRILQLAASPRVVSVRPRFAGETAPGCTSPTDPMCSDSNSDNDIAAASKLIAAADLRSAGYGDLWLAVMDTGIREDHQMLATGLATSAAGGGKLYACVESCPVGCSTDPTKCTTCPEGNPGDVCGEGHGTGTAGILIGDGAKDAQFTGLTAATLDWYAVYKQDCHGSCNKPGKDSEELDACAVIRAFETAVTRSAPVIVAEMQAIGTDLDPINLAAAKAFSEGCAVIAATGNSDEVGTDVACPAREGTVIGVGARYLDGWAVATAGPAQTQGPVNGRYKPDILGPTNTETTSRCEDNGVMFFSYTSGATAFVGGAAALLCDVVSTKTSATDPGHTYAQLILAGSLTGNLSTERFTSEAGSGLLTIQPATSLRWVGKEEIAVDPAVNPDPARVEITKSLYGNFTTGSTIDVALWWPEPVTSSGVPLHHRITLELIDPAGVVKATSDDATSVFQRITYPGVTPCVLSVSDWNKLWESGGSLGSMLATTTSACWKLRISTTDPHLLAGDEIQTVYWAAAVR